MPEPILAPAIGAKVFSDLIAKLAPAVLNAAGNSFKNVLQNLQTTFGPHLEATFERCTKIKTLLNKDEPVELLSQYVSLKFKCAKKDFDDFKTIEEIRKRKRAIISGTAGGGKTIFMKYLWISFFERSQGKIPVFIELRKLNEVSSDDLLLYIYHSIIDARARVPRDTFDKMVGSGLFVFMFDGFDELVIEKRRLIEKQILALAHNNPGLIIIVSGRPDERFDSWQAFSNFSVQPLEKPEVIELIEKLKYDDKEIKKKFVDRVKKDLYEKHKSFLSSPLLATMMLITFREFADIPEKIYLFYDQAFDALFSKHDATKEGFKRKLYTDIPIDEFKKYLSYFCLVSYYDEKYEFNEDDIKRYMAKGLKIDNIKIDIESFLRDLLESVCVMQRDGLQTVFSHRTFQEFFSAYCLARFAIKHVKEILLRVARRPADSVIQMLFDMNIDLVETQFVLPSLSNLVEKTKKLSDRSFFQRYMGVFREEMIVHVMEQGVTRYMLHAGNDNYFSKTTIKNCILPTLRC